jgi:lipid II:glycine glycyltransferase (peptidoglycan interpeptide bridge formation enzyme)
MNKIMESSLPQSPILSVIPTARKADWDTFVSARPGGHLLQSWNWGQCKTSSTWHPLRLALLDKQTNKIVAAAQVLRRTLPGLPPWLGHLAYIPRGPVVDWCGNDQLADHFLTQLNIYLRWHGAVALRLEPDVEAETVQGKAAMACLKQIGFHAIQSVQPLRTIALDLDPDEETLLANMKEKWRYNTRLAVRRGITVRSASTLEELHAWYKLLQTTGQRDQFGIHAYTYYQQAWEELVPGGQARLLLAYAEEELLAGIFVTCVGREAIYLYGASSNERRNLMPNYLLQWEAIKWAKANGASAYDFWGIPPTDDNSEDMAGVYRFKSGWGGRLITYPGNFEYTYYPFSIFLNLGRKNVPFFLPKFKNME